MIKEKNITLKINTNSLLQYYKNIGYIIKLNDTIIIPIEHLPKGSHVNITGICNICGKEKIMMYKTYLRSTENNYCCITCSKLKKNKTMKEKYGAEHALQCDIFIDKAKKTWLKTLGVDHPSKSKKVKEHFNNTMIERYGVKNALENIEIKEKMFLNQLNENEGFYFFQTDNFKEKSKNTMIDKYNVVKFNNREKSKKTCLKKYGVEYTSQNIEILNRILKTSKKMIKFKETDIYYQGSYEKNFLELCEELNILNKIKRGFTVKYKLNDKELVYFPDFFIEELNTIIEIKSLYWYKVHEEKNIIKQKTCINLGYNYILIMNKNYNEFYKNIITTLF